MFRIIFVSNILIYLAFVFGIFMSPRIADAVHSLACGAQTPFYTLLTYAFLHENLEHLVFNLASLFMFAQLAGKLKISEWLAVYFAGAIISALGFLALNPASLLIGASGAISALLGYGVIKQRIYSMLGIFIAINLFSALLGQDMNVAFSAHIIGLLWGALVGAIICGLPRIWKQA